MPYITSTIDGAQIYYRIHNPTPPSQAFQLAESAQNSKPPQNKPTLFFSHGWPFSSRMFDHLILPLVQSHQYRCVSYDRRGFGKSDWAGASPTTTPHPVSLDVFTSDLEQVLAAALPAAPAGTPGFVAIGASMGCGELVHALHGSPALRAQCRGLVCLGSNLPSGVHDPVANPHAPPPELWDAIRAGLRDDRQGFVATALAGVFGAHVGVELAPGQQGRFERLVDEADCVAVEACVAIVMAADLADELAVLGRETAFPVLVVHGDADQGFPLEAGVRRVTELVPRAELKVYEKAAHGLWLTHKERCLEDITELLRGVA